MKIILALVFAFLSSAMAEDVNVTLAWDKNPEPDIWYYKIRIGTTAGNYTQTIEVHDAIEKTIALPKDVMHFAVVHAVNTSGLESPPSKELAFQVFKAGEGKAPSAPGQLKKKSEIQVSLEKSADLRSWYVVSRQMVSGEDASKFFRVALVADANK